MSAFIILFSFWGRTQLSRPEFWVTFDGLKVGLVFLDGLGSLQVRDQAGSIFTGQVFNATCVHGLEHLLDLLFPVPISLGQRKESPNLGLGGLAAYDPLS